ncbi:MAG: hypothetical protein ACQEQF_00610 [Bacillota bacterium]
MIKLTEEIEDVEVEVKEAYRYLGIDLVKYLEEEGYNHKPSETVTLVFRDGYVTIFDCNDGEVHMSFDEVLSSYDRQALDYFVECADDLEEALSSFDKYERMLWKKDIPFGYFAGIDGKLDIDAMEAKYHQIRIEKLK